MVNTDQQFDKEPRSQEGQETSKNGAPKNEVPYPQNWSLVVLI